MSSTDDPGKSGGISAAKRLAGRGSDRAALRRVYEKLSRMSEHLLEIENWFDARSDDLRTAPRRALGGLDDVDRVIQEESATE